MSRLRISPSLAVVLGLATTLVLGGAPVARSETDPEARIAEVERKVKDLEASYAAARAQGADSRRLDEIERRIQILAEEIESLELGEAEPAAPAGAHGLGPAASKVYAARRGVSIGGYGELLYESPEATRQDGSPSDEDARLDALRAVFYFGYKFNDTILFNSELEIEHATTGEGDEERGEVSLEFAYLDFLLRPEANVRAGLILVPVGFINEIHEPPTFLGARRPFVEQSILPTTWREAGVGVFGDAGILTYRAYLTTSLASVGGTSSGAEGFSAEGIREGRQAGSNAAAEDLALSGRLDVRPVGGLTVGASFFAGDTGQGAETPAGEAIGGRTTIVDVHGEYRRRGLQARALWARTSIAQAALIDEAQGIDAATAPLGSVGERQYGWYGEVGYDVLARSEATRQALIPFVRYERYDTQDRVPPGFTPDPAHDATVTTAGVVWKPIVPIAVKADWQRIENGARTGVDQLNVALGFLF